MHLGRGGCEIGQPLWEMIRQFLNTQLRYDPGIVRLGVCLQEMNTTAHTKASLQVFTAAFFTIAQGWEQSKYPLTGKRPNCVTSMPQNTSQQQKGMNWDTRIRLDESPGNCAKWKKKASPQRLYPV